MSLRATQVNIGRAHRALILAEEDRNGRMKLWTRTLQSRTERGGNNGLRRVVDKWVCELTGSARGCTGLCPAFTVGDKCGGL